MRKLRFVLPLLVVLALIISSIGCSSGQSTLLQHTGRSLYSGPSVPDLKWTFNTGGSQTSLTVGVDGTLYAGCDDQRLYAIAPDGSFKWSFTTEAEILSPPVVDRDTIYVRSDKLYAINLDGTLKWSYVMVSPSPYEPPPAIGVDGTVYIVDHDKDLPSDYVRVIDAINTNGTLRWSSEPFGVLGHPPSPVVGANGVISLCVSGGIDVMNPDGSYKFKGSSSAVPLKSDMSPLAVGVDGTVYICGRDPNGACKGDDGLNYGTVGESYLPTFWCSKDHWLYAIDTNGNGSFKWRYNVISPTNSASAISSDGTIYIGCLDGKLYAISPEGILKWSYSTGAEIESPLTIGRDGTIYVGSNKLYAINPDGTLKWSFSTGTQTPADYISSISSLAIGDHIVYVGSNDGKLYAIGNK